MEKPSTYSYVGMKVAPRKAQPKRFAFPMMKAMKYGYSNARAKAMKSLLLKKEFVLELVRMRTPSEVIERLERTYYKDALVKLSMNYHSSDLVQVAGIVHFAKVVAKLGAVMPEGDRPVFNSLLAKWDIMNAKTLLNARRAGESYLKVAPFLIPIGSFHEKEAKAIVEGKSGEIFKLFIKSHLGKRILSSKVARAVEIEALFNRMDTSDIIKLETILDSFYYQLHRSAEFSSPELRPMVRMLRKEIDLKNATVIARLKKHGITDARAILKYIFKNGIKTPDIFRQIIDAKGDSDTLKRIAEVFEFKTVPSSIWELELIVGKKLATERHRAFYGSVLSAGPVLGFLFLIEEEMNNLRKIMVGKEFGVSSDKIEEMLVFP